MGFYRSQYTTKDKKQAYIATTQFEAADARRAFPCWDQPDIKAEFDISIVTSHPGLVAISNMPVKSRRKLADNRVVYKFKSTPVISTYLLYLGVGDFEFMYSHAGNTKVRVVTTRGDNIKKGKYALDIAKKLLVAYEEYFGIAYPLPKLDLIAVPDFAAGAMENWGAITFREVLLLYDPKTSSTRTKQIIAEVISHEIAHQWFGNLVTMKWWNDLWLNESFATFMATKFLDKLYPKWDLWGQFAESAMNTAMHLDSLKSTHPIDVDVGSPSEIREIFDAISYDKGGCILRMLEHYVGEPAFRQGLKNYLTKFKYANAKGTDLWQSIEEAADTPVSSMVKSWLNQSGFPLVKITKKGNKLNMHQERYLLEQTTDTHNNLWEIPINVESTKKVDTKKYLLTHKTDTIDLEGTTNDSWIVNHGRFGFYRVAYDNLDDLIDVIKQKQISEIDRWAIQNDLHSMCIAGRANVKDYLDFADAYIKEDGYLATSDVAHNLSSLYFRAFDNQKLRGIIKPYATTHLNGILSRLGWTPKRGERHTDAMLRGFVISALGRMDDHNVCQQSHTIYKKLVEAPESILPDIIEPICTVVTWQDSNRSKMATQTYEQLVHMYKNAKTAEEKMRFLSTLCGFQTKDMLIRTLDFAMTDAVRSQNVHIPIVKIASNPHGRLVLWPWLKKNWEKLDRKAGRGNPLFNRIISSISSVADITMESEIKDFFTAHPIPGTERSQEQTLERIRINSAMISRMKIEFAIHDIR